MEKIREHKTTILIIGIVLFSVLALAGLTYAWFSATVTGNEEAKTDVVETGELSIVYKNGEEIRGENIVPGWSETKTFTVENTGTGTASYKINWENLTNEFVNKEDLVYSITGDNGKSISETQIPESGEHINIIDNISIEPEEVHTYSMTVKYINRDENQNEDMGKRLNGKIEVVDINGVTGASTIIDKYEPSNNEGLIKIEQPATEQTPELTEYRYTGSSPKNYVRFNDEVWRIIGVFEVDDGTGNYEERIKMIRDASIGKYSLFTSSFSVNDGYGVGTFEDSPLMELLNPGYVGTNGSLYYNAESGTCYSGRYNATTSCNFTSTGLNEESRNMIDDAKWYTGSALIYVDDIDQTRDEIYYDERRSNYNWIGKIALISLSDYGYSAINCDYSYCASWMNPYSEWIITDVMKRNFEDATKFFTVLGSTLSVDYVSSKHHIKPTTYLKTEVKITDGIGTSNDPYILEL